MGRDQKVTTLMNTSVSSNYVRLLDVYIEQEKARALLLNRRLTRASLMEDAILLLLDKQGVLDELLNKIGVPSDEANKLISLLRITYGVKENSKGK